MQKVTWWAFVNRHPLSVCLPSLNFYFKLHLSIISLCYVLTADQINLIVPITLFPDEARPSWIKCTFTTPSWSLLQFFWHVKRLRVGSLSHADQGKLLRPPPITHADPARPVPDWSCLIELIWSGVRTQH
jgi:hypothetical protein